MRYLLYADAEKLADKLKGQASAIRQGAGRSRSAPGAPAGGGGGSNVDASVTIWADVPTNALIMTAPPKIMKNLMAVIDKLDIRRAQVAVEALDRRGRGQQEPRISACNGCSMAATTWATA